MAQLSLQLDITYGGRLSYIPGVSWILTRLVAAQMRMALDTQISAAFAQLGIELDTNANTKSIRMARRNRHPFASIEYEVNLEVKDYASLKGKIPGLPAMFKGKVTGPLMAQVDRALKVMVKEQLISQLPERIKSGLTSKWFNVVEVEAKAG